MEVQVGRVIHYYNRIGVAVLKLTGDLRLGDRIVLLGHTADFTQQVHSLEIEHQKVQSAGPGMEVALKVEEPVQKGDLVYRVED